ncbi:xanthine dehydrogenase family protein molybdopterin-binding subunit [Diaphorobacter caeni]|uniref:xanthine dehydrogenase family protein molybdopterin-binding subunit n=1 Tax=Diaphorobacter caeni TaxID=2784387 RepID=UPI00188EBF2B|nr:xanthine dehydrogenase family protein molybdopterin-binding subunit [Diaphorobacter caeni]MBF5005313.1 xanthine dehydrogenase family protein molybdopterin-binding subunit [Diaphorobacter caeni]
MKRILVNALAAQAEQTTRAAPSSEARRDFLRLSALAGGGLLAGFYLPTLGNEAEAQTTAGASPAFQPNAFVRITPDDVVTVIVGHTEMGQGVATVLPMLVAEEMDADWSRVRWEQAPTDKAYQHPIMHQQLTGGSLTTIAQYEPQRKAGAAVREVLIAAAARKWGVDASTLRTEKGRVLHAASKRSATYGELASDAAGIAVPANPQLKDAKDFKIIGQSPRRLDARAKVDGSGLFGIDMQVPGMLTALLARPPYFGGKVARCDKAAALALPNVVGVYDVPEGVAVVAKDYWSASQARQALQPQYDATLGERVDSRDQRAMYASLMNLGGTVARQDGDVDAALKGAARSLTADYWFPYLTHAPMEPLNAVIDWRGGDGAEVWMSTQWPEGDQNAIARVLGIAPANVKLHTTLTGGGFGRRSTLGFDVAIAAANIAKAVKQPVKMIWTRDQDIRGGYYRPSAYHRVSAALDASGRIIGWSDRIAAQSIATDSVMEPFIVKNGVDALSVEGAEDFPYAVPNVRVDLHTPRFQVPVLWMRSVGHSFNAFAVEHFLDEIAQATKQDPYQMRRALLKDKPRHLAVLDAVARMARWDTPPKPGVSRGIAVHESYGSYVANVIEASVGADRRLAVHKVYCAIDCGVAINPDLVVAQMESSIVFGLSSALMGEVTLEKGQVRQSNFDDYPVLRMHQCPPMEVQVIKSGEKPGGAGEPGVPCVAPALANAILVATGQPVRELPLSRHFTIA